MQDMSDSRLFAIVDKQAVTHEKAAVALGSEARIMSDDDECLPMGVAQLEEKAVQLLFRDTVQISRRFVSEYHSRVIHQGAGYGDSLLFSA